MILVFLMLSLMGAMAIDSLQEHSASEFKVLKKLETTTGPLYYYD